MPTCFMIQPFDGGKFDKRYEQVFKPAIVAAGLEPYRVDQDPRVQIPIDDIEKGISIAAICLADITTDNPNVWYELGYAIAAETPVVMICSLEREGKRFPFDIQHRHITEYKTDAPDDFDKLKTTITARIKALLQRREGLRRLGKIDQVAPVAGLTIEELTVLAVTAGTSGAPESKASLYVVQSDAERANLTKLGVAVGLRGLIMKGFVQRTVDTDHNDITYPAIEVMDAGWDWIENNRSRFVLRRGEEQPSLVGMEITDDDIPF
jgi:hypothetical protein